MTERWARLEQIFHEAGALPEADRPRFLEQACASDHDLRRAVERMLRHADTHYLDTPGVDVSPARVPGTLTGRRFGAYEVGALIGAGGMGEVYRARDTLLGRAVAIKVLPPECLADPARRSRFEREARILASLNHPNIACIFELETSTDVPAIVMELVEGETLSSRIAASPVPLRELVPLATHMADALEAAHEAGIVHRDFKPENVRVTQAGVVKVLDFGVATIARDRGAEPAGADHRTKEGTVLGSAPYMSPEQARGRPVDRRTDIWAFGCVLFEMISGRRAFAGETWSDTVVAVLEREPDWTALPGRAPAALVDLIRRCLEKDPRQRLRDVGDARLELERLMTQSPMSPGRRPMRSAIALAATAAVFAALGAAVRPWLTARGEDAPAPLTAFALELHESEEVRGHPAISPDGGVVAYESERDGVSRLSVRSLGATDARPLAGTEGGSAPFFSPDSQHLAFFAEGKLKRMPIAAGLPYDVCAARTPRGGSWGEDDFIVFADGLNSGLLRVPASGGTPQPFTTLAADEANHRYPHVLPGGRGVLFTVVTKKTDFRIAGLRNGATQHQILLPDGRDAQFGGGRLVYGSAKGEVFSAPFDPVRFTITGRPAAQQERPGGAGVAGDLALSVARNGTMVYVPRHTFPRRLAIADRNGSIQPVQDAPIREYDGPKLAPDGTKILVSVRAGILEEDVWLYDRRGRTLRRLTSDGNSRHGIWTPDGLGVTFDRRSGGTDNAFLVSASADNDAAATQLTHAAVYGGVGGWVGHDLVFSAVDPRTRDDIWIVTPERPDSARPLIVRDRIQWGRPSPDGRWLAIVSDETGAFEVYLTTLPTPGPLTRISSGGGTEPAWSPSSDELFFRKDGEIFGVRMSNKGPSSATARATGIKGFARGQPGLADYDVFADGSFLILEDERPATASTAIVVLNWVRAVDRWSSDR
jgi:Tol biopolymer transport system component/tRNA A-37 threonylcarbamoyl transferase component Bud32